MWSHFREHTVQIQPGHGKKDAMRKKRIKQNKNNAWKCRLARVTSPRRWQFIPNFASLHHTHTQQEGELTIIHGQDTTEKILEFGGEVEAPSTLQRLRKNDHMTRAQFSRKKFKKKRKATGNRKQKWHQGVIIFIWNSPGILKQTVGFEIFQEDSKHPSSQI